MAPTRTHMPRTIRLYGILGSRFGRTYKLVLDSNSPAEAISALSSQLKGFREFLMGAKEKGLGFAVFVGKRSIKEEELSAPSGSEDIRIAPVLLGRKNGGMFNVILGVVLIVVGYFAFGSTTQLGASMIASGIASAATGVVQLLSPQPKGLKSGDRPDNQPSYVFNGAVNTQAQGNPVPVLYGRMIVGSAVVSAGIHAEDYAPATAGVGAGTNLLGRNPKNFYER